MFYCTPSGMTIVGSDSQSSYMFNPKAKTIVEAVQKATTNLIYVEIETIVSNNKKHSLFAADSGDLRLISYDQSGRYDFSLDGSLCTK
jgi:hypothetical protein